MNNLTTTLATLLQGCQAKANAFEYRIYQVIDQLFELQGWNDERRGDLYALLAESVLADDSFGTLLIKVDAALTKNAQRFYG